MHGAILSRRLGVDEIALGGRLIRPKDGAAEPKLAPTVTHGQANKLLIQDRIDRLGKFSGGCQDKQKGPQPEPRVRGPATARTATKPSRLFCFGTSARALATLSCCASPTRSRSRTWMYHSHSRHRGRSSRNSRHSRRSPRLRGARDTEFGAGGTHLAGADLARIRKASPSTDAPPGFTILVATAPANLCRRSQRTSPT